MHRDTQSEYRYRLPGTGSNYFQTGHPVSPAVRTLGLPRTKPGAVGQDVDAVRALGAAKLILQDIDGFLRIVLPTVLLHVFFVEVPLFRYAVGMIRLERAGWEQRDMAVSAILA